MVSVIMLAALWLGRGFSWGVALASVIMIGGIMIGGIMVEAWL